MARTTIRTEDVTDSEVTTAKMATDPTNATNLASGTVPTARLGSGTASSSTFLTGAQTYAAVDTSGITANQDDIALLGFKVAANGSLARYNLVDQSIDAFEDASGVDASASTGEVRDAANYYAGTSTGTPTVTGGTISVVGDYTYHAFLSSGTFETDTPFPVDLLVVAGGGGAGRDIYNTGVGGGGGGGGVRNDTSFDVTAAAHTVTIGGGGTGATLGNPGDDGDDSLFGSYTSTGGGGGGGGSADGPQNNGRAGGSGGGNTGKSGTTGGAGNAGGYSPVEGYAGGETNQSPGNAGGGGGAAEAGDVDGPSEGGDGLYFANFSLFGASGYFGGGGGGGRQSAPKPAPGGAGGGGAGSSYQGTVAVAGTANTGGGSGGSYNGSPGTKDGGSGVVLVRRLTEAVTYNNMTLISNAQTAQDGAPDTGDLVITYTDGSGTAVVNTDIKAYISRDGSDYTDAVTLVSQGTTGGHTILTANGVDLTGETSGTAMRWKIETLNQAITKSTRIQAVSLGWK